MGVTENGGVILCSAIPDHIQNILWGFNWMHGFFNRENKYESLKLHMVCFDMGTCRKLCSIQTEISGCSPVFWENSYGHVIRIAVPIHFGDTSSQITELYPSDQPNKMAWMDISNMIKEWNAWITILLRTIPILVDKNLYFSWFQGPPWGRSIRQVAILSS